MGQANIDLLSFRESNTTISCFADWKYKKNNIIIKLQKMMNYYNTENLKKQYELVLKQAGFCKLRLEQNEKAIKN